MAPGLARKRFTFHMMENITQISLTRRHTVAGASLGEKHNDLMTFAPDFSAFVERGNRSRA